MLKLMVNAATQDTGNNLYFLVLILKRINQVTLNPKTDQLKGSSLFNPNFHRWFIIALLCKLQHKPRFLDPH